MSSEQEKRDVDYWRREAEESDSHEWCEDCENSYFSHFDTCPHCERQLVTDGGRSEAATEHKTKGQIGGHEVTVTVSGPEAQDLGDDDMRLGSDIVALRVAEKLTEIKEELADAE